MSLPRFSSLIVFFVDKTKLLSAVNLKLQDKDQIITNGFENIEGLISTIVFIKNQVRDEELLHFSYKFSCQIKKICM